MRKILNLHHKVSTEVFSLWFVCCSHCNIIATLNLAQCSLCNLIHKYSHIIPMPYLTISIFFIAAVIWTQLRSFVFLFNICSESWKFSKSVKRAAFLQWNVNFNQPGVTLEIFKLSYHEGQRHVINDSAHRTLSPSPDISNPRECWRTLFFQTTYIPPSFSFKKWWQTNTFIDR